MNKDKFKVKFNSKDIFKTPTSHYPKWAAAIDTQFRFTPYSSFALSLRSRFCTSTG